MIFEDIFESAIVNTAKQARHYFIEKDVQPEDVVCAMPAYLLRNMLSLVERTTGVVVSKKEATLCGIPVIAGYENKIVFYYPDWHYNPEIKPFIIEIPDGIKLK